MELQRVVEAPITADAAIELLNKSTGVTWVAAPQGGTLGESTTWLLHSGTKYVEASLAKPDDALAGVSFSAFECEKPGDVTYLADGLGLLPTARRALERRA